MALRINHLGGGSGRRKSSVTLTASAQDGTDSTNYTFNSQNLGEDDPSRFIVVGVQLNATAEPSAVSVGGVACTKAVGVVQTGRACSLWYSPRSGAGGPTGSSGNVAITGGAAASNGSIEVYALKNLASTPTTTGSDTATPLSIALNIPEGGVAIAAAFDIAGAASWTGLTEDVDADVEGRRPTSASARFEAAQTSHAMAVSFTTETAASVEVAAVWGP